MPNGYWIARVDVSDESKYQQYVAANAAAFAKYGARFLVRGGDHDTVEGTGRARNVVIEFPSYEQALECYHSPEYQYAKSLRAGAGDADITVVSGYDGPQPTA
ncbi:DUF1330 domain-containing protein [Cumulibacter manganitolerans]|uniref:DUF1330 domain-containing protein n=1 Tax=Cumulibacter manganitolerans TaxID=1884992 RepID=UPI001297A6BE|nr:DUF1330 domain-containing protein [Cumulibacter manganitolerans]